MVAQLLEDVRALGVRLWADEGRIKFEPASMLTPTIVARIRAHKAELLEALVRAKPAPSPLGKTGRTAPSEVMPVPPVGSEGESALTAAPETAPTALAPTDGSATQEVVPVLSSADEANSAPSVDANAHETTRTPLDTTDRTPRAEVVSSVSGTPQRTRRWDWIWGRVPTIDQIEAEIQARGCAPTPTMDRDVGRCRSCSSPNWWRRAEGGPWVCARCHPTPTWIAAETWSSAGGAS